MRGKKKLSGRGILVKLILAMMLLSIMSVAIILAVALNEQKQIMERNLIEENERLAEVAARSIEADYITRRHCHLKRCIRSMLQKMFYSGGL